MVYNIHEHALCFCYALLVKRCSKDGKSTNISFAYPNQKNAAGLA
jgi:hypothetical protein